MTNLEPINGIGLNRIAMEAAKALFQLKQGRTEEATVILESFISHLADHQKMIDEWQSLMFKLANTIGDNFDHQPKIKTT